MTADPGTGAALVWDDALAAYDFGRGHPLDPVRVELTVALIRACGLLDADAARQLPPAELDDEALLAVHDPAYLEAVRGAGSGAGPDPAHGLGPGDNPVFEDMHGASRRVCGATRAAAEAVWEGTVAHALNPAGGLHHAMPGRASGFCVYNDPAVAIEWLLSAGAGRVCYLDVDVHHGDGVERIFWDDPRVLTISLHESGRFLFPGTGRAEDTGGPDAPASAANLPLHPGTTGDVWLDVFDRAAAPLARAFDPDVLVTQLGCDTHATDPLAHLALTLDTYAAVYARLHDLAHELCGGRWVATGGGGYQLVSVVPRAWTLAFAELAGADLPAETPMSWRRTAEDAVTAEHGAGRAVTRKPPTGFDEQPAQSSRRTREQARAAAEESVETCRRLVLDRIGVG